MNSWIILLIISLGTLVRADQSFLIYAPGRSTQSLFVLEAKVSDESVKLNRLPDYPLGFSGTTITDHPSKGFLYITTNTGPEGQCPAASIELDQKGIPVKHRSYLLKNGYAGLAVNAKGTWIAGASYRTGWLDQYRLNDRGGIGEILTSRHEDKKNAHFVLISPDQKNLYVPYVKDFNALLQYGIDADTGVLAPLQPLDAKPPTGTGPRHLVIHPGGDFIYTSNEQRPGASVYQRMANGRLKLLQICDAFEALPRESGLSSSDIQMTPDGRFVFVGIRDREKEHNAIAGYQVNDDKTLSFLGRTPADPVPWGFALSPDGRHLLVTGTLTGTLQVFRINRDGQLALAARFKWRDKVTDLLTRPK